jgi:hypothetical protein
MNHSGIIFFSSLFVLSSLLASAGAQELQELYQLYSQKKISQLNEKVVSLEERYPDSIELKFFQTLFVENGDHAIKTYENLYDNAQGIIKRYIARKIAEYYYAMGYYVKASKYLEMVNSQDLNSANDEFEVQKSSPPTPTQLVIQVGAFKFIENAQYLQKILQSHNIASRVITREIENKSFYCVWLEGKSNFEETREYAENIKKELNLQYRIINP